ncbi:FadR/GntR family transcriptional regulator [Rhodococcus wratislaviensis]|uniref:Putative GntR family transcriptional regulator n=1 Tax=Rhodococcus wratislaviensis NBRC 100605 TaxID=1219028 RepID=X0Q1D5_RHOWR|nr:GntR family transcriptional regulator [Rhodococcus wratislaviensis]GAF44707.1 putative GntR family transcriptional regulator [Rhodococcus wratislaviensis NBRC 100605]
MAKSSANGMAKSSADDPISNLAVRRAIAATRGEKVSRTVARLVARTIADDRLQPGAALPSEQEMANNFGVGRASVREGLRLLEAQGLVTMRQGVGGGPSVAEPTGAAFGDTMSMYLQVNDIRLYEVVEAVIEMEGLAAALAADKVARGEIEDPEELEALEPHTDDITSNREFIETSVGFHDHLRQLAGNYILALMGSALAHLFSDRAIGAHPSDWNDRERTVFADAHAQIGRAIRAGDAATARQLAMDHMRDAVSMTLGDNPTVLQDRVDWK